MNKLYRVQAQTRSFTDEVIVSAEVVATSDEEAKEIFVSELFHSGKLYDFLTSTEEPVIPTEETPRFRRLDKHYLNY